jgi:colanic acid biosynthesis glycosyl transferase WcaI
VKILFFSDHFRPEPSAPAAHVHERARIWVEQGHQVTVVTSAPNFPEGRVYDGYRNRWRGIEEMDGIRVVRVKTLIAPNEGFIPRVADYASYMLSAYSFGLFEEKPDVVMSTSPHLFVPVAAAAWARTRNVPHVMEVRDLWPASIASTQAMRDGRLFRMLERLELALYRSSTRVLLLTESFRRDLVSRGVPAAKLDVVLNGASLDIFAPQPKDPALLDSLGLRGRFTVGYLGTVGLAHDLHNVIHAAELLRGTEVAFLIVGAGAAKAGLEEEARRLGLDNVVFVPRQLRERMPDFWSVCDAGLIHLRDDPLFATVIPSKIFESMAMGLPIVYAGPVGEGTEIVQRHDAGVVVPPAAPRALADAVLALAADPQRRAVLAEHSRAAAPLFSRARQAEATLAVLRAAVGNAA